MTDRANATAAVAYLPLSLKSHVPKSYIASRSK